MFIRRISDFLLASYLFIASAAFCLVLSTLLVSTHHPELTPLSILIFFSTLLIYNFHKVSNLFTIPIVSVSYSNLALQLKNISRLTKLMICIALAGISISGCFVQPKTLLCFIPLALITFAYSVPILKLHGKWKRLREIFLVKIITLSFVWSFTTVILPLIDNGTDLFSTASLFVFVSRFLFLFAICIPFEIRDMDLEKKWGNTTLPVLIGVKRSKLIGLLALLIFILSVHFQATHQETTTDLFLRFEFPQYLTGMVASLLIWVSNVKRSKYFFRLFVDGTMHLQFFLLLLFSHIT